MYNNSNFKTTNENVIIDKIPEITIGLTSLLHSA